LQIRVKTKPNQIYKTSSHEMPTATQLVSRLTKTMQWWMVQRPLDGAVVARLSKENGAVARLPKTKGRGVEEWPFEMVVAKGVGAAFGRRLIKIAILLARAYFDALMNAAARGPHSPM
jgi:hypothetical protein